MQTSSRFAFPVALTVMALLAVILAFPGLDTSLQVDEPYTANLVHLSLPEIWQVHQQVGYEVTYHLLLKPWTTVFGETEVALRSLSLLFYVLTIAIVGLTAQQIGGKRAGLSAAFLMAVSTRMGLVHAANARPYALLALQVSLATLTYFHLWGFVLKVGRVREAPLNVVLTVLNVLGLMNHPIYLFYMVACTLAAALVSRRAFVIAAACSAVSLGVYLLLWWPALQVSLSLPHTSWMRAPTLTDLADAYLRLWGGGSTLLLVGCIVGSVILRGGRGLAARPVLVSLTIAVAASLLPFAVSQIKPIFNPQRTPMIFLPMASVLVALLLARPGWRGLTGMMLAVVGLTSISDTAQRYPHAGPFQTYLSVEDVIDRAQCGDTFVLGGLSFSAVEYYLRRLGASDCIRRETFPLDTQSHPGWIDVPGLLDRRDELTDEAAETATRLAGQPRATIWLFYLSAPGPYREITDILKLELDRRLRLVETLPLRGLFFDSIVVYSTEVSLGVNQPVLLAVDSVPHVVDGNCLCPVIVQAVLLHHIFHDGLERLLFAVPGIYDLEPIQPTPSGCSSYHPITDSPLTRNSTNHL